MRYDWLFLDADGTLFDYEQAERTALRATFDEFGQPYGPGCLVAYRRINKQMWDAVERGTVSEGDLPVRRFVLLGDALGLSWDGAASGASYLRHLGECADLMPEAEETLAALCGRVGLVAVSNGLKDVQRSRLARSSIARFLHAVVISGEVGFAKPDARIFRAALARAGSPPAERVLMVGDSLTADIAGGRAAGLDTCWYNPTAQPTDPAIRPVHEIRRLSELLELANGS
jgi:2-haloacid dehalogenase